MGDPAPLRLIERQLIVGDKLGTIPETAPTVPLQRDLEQQQKSLRLKPEAARKVLDLDLRQANDLARSHLLHRLRLLEIGWATPGGSRNAKGTFHELWEMQWVPELPIAVIAASRWGNTILEAATAKAVELSGEADLLRLAELVNDILFADLPDAVGHATRMLEEKAATANDVGQLLEAIPPLAAIARYGNVRQTDAGMVARVLEGLIPRASIGLPGPAPRWTTKAPPPCVPASSRRTTRYGSLETKGFGKAGCPPCTRRPCATGWSTSCCGAWPSACCSTSSASLWKKPPG